MPDDVPPGRRPRRRCRKATVSEATHARRRAARRRPSAGVSARGGVEGPSVPAADQRAGRGRRQLRLGGPVRVVPRKRQSPHLSPLAIERLAVEELGEAGVIGQLPALAPDRSARTADRSPPAWSPAFSDQRTSMSISVAPAMGSGNRRQFSFRTRRRCFSRKSLSKANRS